jgi:DNA mismatch repair ATPase MutS
MLFRRSKKVAVFAAMVFCSQAMLAEESLVQFIAKENMKSLSDVKPDDRLARYQKIIQTEGFAAYMKTLYKDHLEPSCVQKRQAIFSLLTASEGAIANQSSQTLDPVTIQDLELLCGAKSNPLLYVASQVNRTITECGRGALILKVARPAVDIPSLAVQQNAVKSLVENTVLFDALDAKMRDMNAAENALVSYMDPNDMFRGRITKFPFEHKIRALQTLSHVLNTREDVLDAIATPMKVIKWGLLGSSAIGSVGASVYKSKKCWNDTSWRARATKFGGPVLTVGSLGGSWALVSCVNRYLKDVLEYEPIGFYTKVSRAAHFFKHANDMVILASADQAFSQLPAVQRYNEFMRSTPHHEQIAHLLALAEGDFSKPSHQKVANFLIHDISADYVEFINIVGELDAQLSIAKLYKEGLSQRVGFCFPEFITDGQVPVLSATECWNPMIAADKVVANSMCLSGDNSGHRCVVITGPNAGGKSTITKSFVLAAIMAQSLGIAPAREMQLTPFNGIMTYLNITDDIAAGESHYMAGVNRAKKLMARVAANTTGFTLTAVDEAFNGTSKSEQEAAAYTLTKVLAYNPRNICITNTHAMSVPTLEGDPEASTVNYKVTVDYHDDETFTCPYLLEPGVTNQNVAVAILKREGFGDSFVNEMNRVLNK